MIKSEFSTLEEILDWAGSRGGTKYCGVVQVFNLNLRRYFYFRIPKALEKYELIAESDNNILEE